MAERDVDATFVTALGGDDNGTVGGVATIECGSCCTGEHGHRFNIFGVDVGNGFSGTFRAERTVVAATVEVEHWHTVNHVEGIARLVDGFCTTHHHLGSTTHARRRGVDGYTCNFTTKRVDEVGIFHCGDFIALNFLCIVAQCLAGALDTEGCNHHFFEHLVVLLKGDIYGRVAWLNGLSLITDVADGDVAAFRHLEREVTVDVGGGANRCSRHLNGGTDERLAVLIDNLSGYVFCFACLGLFNTFGFGIVLLEIHNLVVDGVTHVFACQHLCENLLDGLVVDFHCWRFDFCQIVIAKKFVSSLVLDTFYHSSEG